MNSINTEEFRYDAVIIILVNLAKPSAIRDKAVEIDRLSMNL